MSLIILLNSLNVKLLFIFTLIGKEFTNIPRRFSSSGSSLPMIGVPTIISS